MMLPYLSWMYGGGMPNCRAQVLVSFRIPSTARLTTSWYVLLWRGDTRRLRVSTFRSERWQWHLMMCLVCCIFPLMACFCPIVVSHGTRRWTGWWSIWGQIRVTLYLRWIRPKVHIVDSATWGRFSRSVCWSSWSWRLSMVWLRRCGGCGTRLSAYICYTWWGSRSSLTRTPLSTWGTLETLILLLVIHGELRH